MAEVMTKEILKGDALEKVPLGEGLELWKVHVAMLKEQNVNARSMTSPMFMQLMDNIKRQKGLESLPLCALTKGGVEIVSGHHRVRAARKAGIQHIWIMIDITGLSRDELRAKQLAHNSIQGEDNADLVKQIYEQIQDVASRIESYIEPNMDELNAGHVTLTGADLEIKIDSRLVNIAFLPVQYEVFKFTMGLLADQGGEVFLAARDEYETLIATMESVSTAFDIHNTPTLFAKMAEIVEAHLLKDEL